MTYKERTFQVEILPDDIMGPPWKEHDGHGVVSEWTTRAKRPGERVLIADRGSFGYYDIEATIKIATRDQWGTGGGPAPGESDRAYRARAVEADFAYLHDWCHDQWHWVCVEVTLLDDAGNPTPFSQILGGIEDRDEGTIQEVAEDLADEILADLPDGVAREIERERERIVSLKRLVGDVGANG